LLEVCRGSGLSARLRLAQLPLIPSAQGFAAQGVVTGASGRNWASYGAQVQWPEAAPPWLRHMLTDPQTSGGLLVSCAPEALGGVLQAFREAGFAHAAAIGEMCEKAQNTLVDIECLL